MIARLKSVPNPITPSVIVFSFHEKQGLDALISAAKGLLGHDKVRGHIVPSIPLSCFRPGARIFRDQAEAAEARQAFARAGRVALEDKRASWGDPKT